MLVNTCAGWRVTNAIIEQWASGGRAHNGLDRVGPAQMPLRLFHGTQPGGRALPRAKGMLVLLGPGAGALRTACDQGPAKQRDDADHRTRRIQQAAACIINKTPCAIGNEPPIVQLTRWGSSAAMVSMSGV